MDYDGEGIKHYNENSAGCIGAILAVVLALAWAACANPGIFWSTNRHPGKQQRKKRQLCAAAETGLS
jgi:hypothetical protein